MPIYEYSCSACGKHHEVLQKITDDPLAVCPSCGGPLKKLMSNTSFVLKGTGWYATDYASDKNKGGKTEKTPDKKAGDLAGVSAAAKTETKAETKTDTASDTKKTAASA